VDFPAVFERLKKGGFTHGPLIIECLDPGDAEQTLVQAGKTRLFLEELTGQKTSPSSKSSVEVSGLTAGLAVVDITPPVGYRMSGYFSERLSTGTSNPLRAKAIVLRQGSTSAALVFCDIIGLSLDVSSRVRRIAAKKTGIPAENILIAATHSHTGPLYFGALRKHFHQLAIAEHGRDSCEKVDYSSELAKKIIRVITQANKKTKPVQLKAGAAEQQNLSFNRRFHMKNGTVRFNPGVMNPDIVRAAGPIDPEVGIVFFNKTGGGGPNAALVNFTLHLDTVGGTKYAADYPFYIEQVHVVTSTTST
jgi:hypothetical protein